jgi:predicted MPP superfamily phosphohydrolase
MYFESIAVVVIVFVAVASYFFLILPTQWLKVERIHYPCGLGIRILQISDMHVERLRIGDEKLVRLIREEKPDYIFLTGDYTEKPRYIAKVERYVRAISSAGIPMFAVLGNHDHRLKADKLNQLIRIFEAQGVKLLNNEAYATSSFQIVGIDDLSSKKSNVAKAFENVDPQIPTIVITHDPNTVLDIKRDFTYLMAGHFHGMQFRLPFLYKFLKKGELAAKGIIKGLHTSVHGSYYISKGIGQAGLNARFLIRSEVTIHEL